MYSAGDYRSDDPPDIVFGMYAVRKRSQVRRAACRQHLQAEGNQMVKINGKELAVAGMTIGAFLEREGYDIKRIAVERNGAIVPKVEYAAAVLEDGDSVEVVSFVGGG